MFSFEKVFQSGAFAGHAELGIAESVAIAISAFLAAQAFDT